MNNDIGDMLATWKRENVHHLITAMELDVTALKVF